MDRSSFLDEACEGDDGLRDEVESLLAQEASDVSILEPGRVVDRVAHPHSVGPYRISEVLGEGGMGVVYRALQTEPIEREVALKVVRWGMDTERVVARFGAERQTLASLDHPHIAKVLDAGADERGRPYFVMELVRGEAITHFADQHQLGVAARVDLFLDVCRAVQHAHQRGVIHRDLKPSNILVSQVDDGPSVKVIDFGIAKAVEQPAGSTMTQVGQIMGTPQYMSPEQAGLQTGTVDTRTDVYSLGVVLYELLTGHRPLQFDTLSQLEILRVLRESEPARPSVAVQQIERDVTPETVATSRRTTMARLQRVLTGDLENILSMAMRKEPEGRYASVEQLAEDLGRYRSGLPVRARKPTWTYRTGKFVRRNAVGVALAAAAAVFVLGFVATTLVQSALVAEQRDRAVAAEARATAEAETARRSLAFMVELFEVSDPNEAKGNTVTAREILDRGAQRIRGELTEAPEVRAALMDAIGRVYQSLGLWSEAEPLLSEALTTRREVLGENHLDTAQSMSNLAFLLQDLGRLIEAESLMREALVTRSAQLDPTDELVTSARFALASVLQRLGDLDAAKQEFGQVLEIERQTLGENHPFVAMTLNNLATVHLHEDELEEAAALFRQSLAINLATGGPDHPETATNYSNLATVYMRQGNAADALVHATHALEIRQKVYGEEHPHVAISLNMVALHLNALGRPDEAEERFREALAMRRRLQGDRHPQVGHNLMGLGAFLSKQGRHDEALPLLQEALAINRDGLGNDHTDTARTLYELGFAHLRSDAPAAAEPLLVQALRIRRQSLTPTHRETLQSLRGLGACYLALQRLDEAEALLLEAHRGTLERHGPDHERTTTLRAQLVELYEARGDETAAARYRPQGAE
ncbi:MAG: serine/threonine-protein kinase [Myxococcales bacterium]|nr:serine/threonine-protein kinase [Myxococcales bacterium]